MSLSKAPVQLLNLSVGQLSRIASQQWLSPDGSATKIDLTRLLVEGLEPAALRAAADDYLYAGKTSVTWVRFDGGAPVTLTALKSALTTMCGADPFASELRPELDGTPRLLHALNWHNGKVVLTFAVRGQVRLVFQGYELREVSEDFSFQVVVRLADGVFEIRSGHLYAQRLQAFMAELGTRLGRTPTRLPIEQAQFDALHAALNASLRDYTGLDGSPSPYQTRSVSKKQSCPDLAVEPAFQQDYGSLEPVSGDLIFVGPEGEEMAILVAIRTSSVYFRSAASEATIDLVYSALKQVWP